MRIISFLFLCFAFAVQTLSAQVVVSGEITTNTTWTKNNAYLLSGFVYVKNGATLTIEPGTIIKGDKATKGTLIVTRGAKIRANGTANQPIVFTSNQANPDYGDWGGLIILGRANTNQKFNNIAGLGEVEGGVNNAAGDGLYGGGDLPGGAIDTDTSGTLRYVRVEYPGIAFAPNNEINGITMAGVGSGTVIEYVQVSYCNDDSFEWFGGTVNAKYLIAYRGLDDDFDCDFGYRGKVQFALAVRDAAIADGQSGSNGFEVDNDAAGSATDPRTAPTFSNVTIVGPAAGTVSADYRRAAHLRRNCEIGIFNSILMGAYPVGILIDGANTGQNAVDNKLEIKNTFVAGPATLLNTAGTGNPLTISTWFGTSGWGNKTYTSTDSLRLKNPFNLGEPNAQPLAGSPALGAAAFTAPRLGGTFFTPTSYIGAFDGNNDWTCLWARYAAGVNISCNAVAQVVVSGDITTNTTWTRNNVYRLTGFVYVKNGATLTIEPGTVIRGDKATKGTLIITRGSKIIADGTVDQPIVFTSNQTVPDYGDWGGLILLGKASTNQKFNNIAGLGEVEGGVNNAAGDGLYGGGDLPGGAVDNDNSGILRYVRVEYSGIAFAPNNEINGITMAGVGSGTIIDYVQVSYNNDDSFEWFGGTVNAKHLIAYRGLDDDFDCDFGFRGNIQFALSVRDAAIADGQSGSNGFEIDNDASGSATNPRTAPTFSNVTIIGPAAGTVSPDYRRAAHLRRNCEIGIFNSVLIGSYPVGILIDGANTGQNAVDNKLEIKNTIVAGPTTLLNTAGTNNPLMISSWFNTTGWGNKTFTNSTDVKLQNPFNLADPNAQPTFSSPALAAASFTYPRVANSFFTPTTYVGAFGGGTDWTCRWASFAGGLNTSCNVKTEDFAEFVPQVSLTPTVTSTKSLLQFELAKEAEMSVRVYNLQGNLALEIAQDKLQAGNHTYEVNAQDLTSGMYFVVMQTNNSIHTEKLIVLK